MTFRTQERLVLSPPAAASWNPAGWIARLRETGPVLVCAFDGVSLRGAVATRVGKACNLSTVATSKAVEPSQALREVLDALARKGVEVPRQACLATPQAAPAFLDIGVDPARPRSAQEMNELVRWDMEAELATSAAAWTVTGVLVMRGNLTSSQAADLLAEAALDGLQGANAINRRAAELAVEQRLINTDTLAAANSQVVRLAGGDEETLCAWAAPDKKSGSNAGWFCASISANAREEWRAAFAEAGHRLTWIYPIVGAASLARLSVAGSARELALEVHPSQLAAISLRNNRIVNLQVASLRAAQAREAATGLVEKAAAFHPDRIAILGPEEAATAIQQSLAASWTLSVDEAEPLAGLGAHALGLTGAGAIPRIAAADPPPPLWRNPDVVRIGAFCLVLLALGGVELMMRWRVAAAQTRLTQIERQSDEMAQRDRQVQQQVNEARAKEDEKSKASAELEQVRTDLRVIRDVLAVREKMIPGLVGALQRAVNDDVFLNSVTETGLATGTFDVRGWGMTDTAIHLFTTKLEREIGPMLRMSGGEEMRRGRDRLDLDGYLFSVRLARPDPTAAQKLVAPRLAAPPAPATPVRGRVRR